jgi:hypothetical protein
LISILRVQNIILNKKVIGIELGGKAKVYAFSELSKSQSPVKIFLTRFRYRFIFDRQTQTAVIRNDKYKELPAVAGFWFSWYAFHPAIEIFVVEQE